MHAILKIKYPHILQINFCNHGIENACEKAAHFLPLEVFFQYNIADTFKLNSYNFIDIYNHTD